MKRIEVFQSRNVLKSYVKCWCLDPSGTWKLNILLRVLYSKLFTLSPAHKNLCSLLKTQLVAL